MIRDLKKIQDLVPVRNAFISLSNKTASEKLADELYNVCPGLTIFSSGGTYAHLKKNFNPDTEKMLIEASEYTGMPETEGGLVKTLHHKFFLGYLTETFCEAHQQDLERENAVPIDLVIVDLYPFADIVAKPGSTIENCRGNIDVGGPSGLRAAAKNWPRVMVIPGYSEYAYRDLITRLRDNNGCTDLFMRLAGFKNTFKMLAEYDKAIAEFASEIEYGDIAEVYEIV